MADRPGQQMGDVVLGAGEEVAGVANDFPKERFASDPEVERRRAEYMSALEAASVAGNIKPLARFIAEEMQAHEERLSID